MWTKIQEKKSKKKKKIDIFNFIFFIFYFKVVTRLYKVFLPYYFMEREVDDHKKADLEKVLCDNYVCGIRGDYGKCYMDIYKKCQDYLLAKQLGKRRT